MHLKNKNKINVSNVVKIKVVYIRMFVEFICKLTWMVEIQ